MKMCIQGWSAFMQIYIYIHSLAHYMECDASPARPGPARPFGERRLRRQRWDDDKMNHVRKEFGKALHFRHFFLPVFLFCLVLWNKFLLLFCWGNTFRHWAEWNDASENCTAQWTDGSGLRDLKKRQFRGVSMMHWFLLANLAIWYVLRRLIEGNWFVWVEGRVIGAECVEWCGNEAIWTVSASFILHDDDASRCST